ncbi:MAG: glycoside hydrolase family 127 protein [Clostridiales bacterium]|nr:glycoside hydrolase family 127 protein [Clostridiales bacterium]
MKTYTTPLGLRQVRVTDAFWKHEMELVRTRMIPYQWEALNDRIPGAAPSWCVHNFRAAARLQARRRAGEPWTYEVWKGTFETLPRDGEDPDQDTFYGFVFQDSDMYKWLEAVSYSLMQHPDAELEKTASEMAELVCSAQDPDGYLDTFYILKNRKGAFSNLKDHHELYCLGHLTEAAVAWHQATGKTNLLETAERFADCVAEHIGLEEGKKPGYPGHEIAEMALLRLYEETGEERFLKQCRYFLDQRGQKPHVFLKEVNLERAEKEEKPLPEEDAAKLFAYYQAHEPVRRQREAVGHAVRAMYLYSGMADLARLDGDEEMAHACEELWKSTTRDKMYITGGVGATHVGEAFSRRFDLPNDTAYSETCAAVGLVFFARRMLQMHPRSEYADVMERALINTVLAGMAMDGQSFFYVNPLEVDPEACRTDKRLNHVKHVRQKWFGCACCPPNVARLLSSLPQYAFTGNGEAVYVHLYMASDAETMLGGKPLCLHVRDGWMQGRVHIDIESDGARGDICVRLPGWCADPSWKSTKGSGTVRDGYVVFSGEWKAGDSLDLELPFSAVCLEADWRVREDAGKAAVQYGPFVMCTEEKDNGHYLHMLKITPDSLDARVEKQMIGGIELPVLQVRGKKLAQEETAALYTPWKKQPEEDTRVTMVPYFAWGNRGEGEMRVWQRTE